MLRTIVCDDERPALELIVAMLARTGKVEIVGAFQAVEQALCAINRGGIDLAVLDVEMPGLSGVEAAQAIRVEPRPLVVFATAHPEYALDAFGIDAIDYLLKPLDTARVCHAVDKAVRLLGIIRNREASPPSRPVAPAAEPTSPDELRFQDAGRFYVLPLREIIWIEAAGDYSLIHMVQSELAVRRTLSSLEESLPMGRFQRVHRSSIVATGCIRQIRRLAKGEAEIVLSGGVTVRSSRSYREAVDRLTAG